MVLVILQHSYLNVDMKLIPHLLDVGVWRATHLAAIAFVSISGAMFSYYLYRSSDWRAAYRRSAARAAFLLLVAHYALGLTSYFSHMVRDPVSPWAHACATYLSGVLFLPGSPWVQVFLERYVLGFPITDMIGICLLVSPVFILFVGPVPRTLIVVTLLTASSLVVGLWHPSGTGWLILKEAIFGSVGDPSIFWWPLASWFAIFLTGSFAGQALARLKQGAIDHAALVRKLNKTGLALASCSIVLTLCYVLLKRAYGLSWDPDIFRAIYPKQTTTLLPGYLAVLACLFAFLMQRIDIDGKYGPCVWSLSIFGRTSLFTYIVQYAVVLSGPAVLGLTGSLGLTGFVSLFAVGLVVDWLLSYFYGRWRGWFKMNDYQECVAQVRARS